MQKKTLTYLSILGLSFLEFETLKMNASFMGNENFHPNMFWAHRRTRTKIYLKKSYKNSCILFMINLPVVLSPVKVKFDQPHSPPPQIRKESIYVEQLRFFIGVSL